MQRDKYRGVVQQGKRRGAQLGFPTINVEIEGGENAGGIFSAKVFIDGKEYFAAAYINESRKILEAHLLDFSGDLYGQEVEIELLKKIREDRKFQDEAALEAAIADDVAKIRKYLKN